MELAVRTVKGDHITLRLESHMRVIELKKMIAGVKPELTVEHQRLIYKGKVLSDDMTIHDVGWEPKDFIVVVASNRKPSKIEVHVKSLAGCVLLELQMPRNSTVLDLKARISKACGVPSHLQKLVLQTSVLQDEVHLRDFGDSLVLNLVRLPEVVTSEEPSRPDALPVAPLAPGQMMRGPPALAPGPLLRHPPPRRLASAPRPTNPYRLDPLQSFADYTTPPSWLTHGLEKLRPQEQQFEIEKRITNWRKGAYKSERPPLGRDLGPREPPRGST